MFFPKRHTPPPQIPTLKEYHEAKKLLIKNRCDTLRSKFIISFTDSVNFSNNEQILIDSRYYTSFKECGIESVETLIDGMKDFVKDKDVQGNWSPDDYMCFKPRTS